MSKYKCNGQGCREYVCSFVGERRKGELYCDKCAEKWDRKHAATHEFKDHEFNEQDRRDLASYGVYI